MLTILKEIAGILVDSALGSRCPECRERQHNLALHVYVDHADTAPPPEQSRFAA